MRRTGACAALAVAAAVADLSATDHKNLDEGRPLRLEDPYVIPWRSFAVESGAAFLRRRAGRDRGLLTVEILYGAARNLQVGARTSVSSRSEEVDHQGRPGDLRLGALYSFNQESLGTPALGAGISVLLPTAPGSRGADVEISGILKKSAGRLGLHLNLARELRGSVAAGERSGVWRAAAGASWPIGAPRRTRTLLVGDLFAEQAAGRGEEASAGAEIGVRFQWRPRVVLDAGAGTEVRGPDGSTSFIAAAGLSFGW